jgi:MFS family permease
MLTAPGVFQTYYEKTFPHISASSISWIGSIHLALLIALGVVTGPLFDYGYLRSLVCIGSFLSVLGMIMISISTQYWHLVVSQGVLLGIGSGCLFIPSIAVLPTYFSKKQTLVLGIGSSGAALGVYYLPLVILEILILVIKQAESYSLLFSNIFNLESASLGPSVSSHSLCC